MLQALTAAKELVRLSLTGDEPDLLTNRRLQKLLYYAQAWSLVIRQSELYPDDIQAWRHGPVVPGVFKFIATDGTPINPSLFEGTPEPNHEEAAFLEKLWESYRQYSPSAIADKTQGEKPWIDAWGKRPADENEGDEITVSLMEQFFESQPIPGPLAEYEHKLRRQEDEARSRLAGLRPSNLKRFQEPVKPGAAQSADALVAGG